MRLKALVVYNYAPDQPPQSSRGWFPSLSPRQQIGYGCIAIVIIGAAIMYCAGTISLLVRPSLLQRAPTPTALVRPTLAPTPTQAPPTFINLPGGTLVATPTQAPIPTRELPTLTPTVDLTNPAPTLTITATLGASRTPTRQLTTMITPRR